MIIVQLLVTDQQQGQAVAESILRNKFSVNVFGSFFDSYHLHKTKDKEQTQVYVIQFVTKSLLFHEIEASLKNEFPKADFSICATPLVHIGFNLHDKIRKKVIGITSNLETMEN